MKLDRHCVNGPAWDTQNNVRQWGWLLFGRLHRYYGPQSNLNDWWIHDRHMKSDEKENRWWNNRI